MNTGWTSRDSIVLAFATLFGAAIPITEKAFDYRHPHDAIRYGVLWFIAPIVVGIVAAAMRTNVIALIGVAIGALLTFFGGWIFGGNLDMGSAGGGWQLFVAFLLTLVSAGYFVSAGVGYPGTWLVIRAGRRLFH